MAGAKTSRHSDTRLPRPPREQRTLVHTRPLPYRPVPIPPAQDELPYIADRVGRYLLLDSPSAQTVGVSATGQTNVVFEVPSGASASQAVATFGSPSSPTVSITKAGQISAGFGHFTGLDTTTVPLRVQGAAGATANTVEMYLSNGVRNWKTTTGGTHYWSANERSFLGANGELWMGANIPVFGGFYYNAMSIANSTLNAGYDSTFAMVGDTTAPASHVALKFYLSVVGHSIFDIWYLYMGGADGRIHQKLQTGTTIAHQITAHTTQTGAMIRAESNGAARWFEVASDGKVQLTNGVAIDEFSTDTALSGNSDLAVPTEKAVKAYADLKIPKSTITTSGDLILGTGSSTVARLGVGDDYQALTAKADATNDIEWMDPPLAKELEFHYSEATASGSDQKGHGSTPRSDDNVRFSIPSGWKFIVTYVSASWKSGSTGSVDYIFQPILYGDSATDIGSAMSTTTADEVRHDYTTGSLASPIATISGATSVSAGWRNDTDTEALGSFTHQISIIGYLVQT